MTKIEFEKKYLEHNFFWIENEIQSQELQKILLEFGYKNPIGECDTIEWHDGFNNLVTYQPEDFHPYKRFQKTAIYNPDYSFGEAINYEKFIADYKSIKSNN